jgi:Cu(I)/Ag(I) efflux system membrane fusion protein
MSEIRKGLGEGAVVVLSGQFLIDSEASLSGAISRMGAADIHKGRGKVTKIDAAKGHVEIDHEPMPSLQWPAMQMGFVAADKGQLSGLKRGDTVQFELRSQPDQDGNYVIESIRK